MRVFFNNSLVILLTILVISFIASCGGNGKDNGEKPPPDSSNCPPPDSTNCPPPGENKAPVIDSITHSPEEVFVNSMVDFKVYARDEDNDTLTYHWGSNSGTFTYGTEKQESNWRAPSQYGNVNVWVTVSDIEFSVSETIVVFVDESAEMKVNPTQINLGESNAEGEFYIINLKGDTLSWEIEKVSANISSYTPEKGNLVRNESDTVRFTLSREGLLPGEYKDTIFVSSNAGKAKVYVLFIKPTKPALSISPKLLDFGIDDISKEFIVTNSGTGILEWKIGNKPDFVTVNPESGSVEAGNNQKIMVKVNRGGLDPGYTEGDIIIESNGGEDSVRIKVGKQGADIEPESFSFSGFTGVDSFKINNIGAGRINWKIINEVPWLKFPYDMGYIEEDASIWVKFQLEYTPVREGINENKFKVVIVKDTFTINVKWDAPFKIWLGKWTGITNPQFKDAGFYVGYREEDSVLIVYAPYAGLTGNGLKMPCSGDRLPFVEMPLDPGNEAVSEIDENNHFYIDLSKFKPYSAAGWKLMVGSYIEGTFIHADSLVGKLNYIWDAKSPRSGICSGEFNFNSWPEAKRPGPSR